MTFYTPITTGAAANATTFNGPLGELDSAIADITLGDVAIDQLNLEDATALTIAAGEITVNQSWHRVDTEGAAAADNLDLIQGGQEGDQLYLQVVSAARVVTVRHNAGNIKTASGSHVALNDQNRILHLMYAGTLWCEVGEGQWSTKLSLGVDTTLTIATGKITITKSRHKVDTQGAAATDNLDEIDNDGEGDFLVISSVSAARVVTIRHGANNILMKSGNDLVLDDPNREVMFISDGTNWHELAAEGALMAVEPINTTAVPVRKFTFPVATMQDLTGEGNYGLALMPSPEVRNWLRIKAYSTTFKSGDVNFTVSADAATVINVASGNYTQLTTAATTNDAASLVTDVYTLIQTRWDPTFIATVQVDGLTNRRVWIGMFESAPGNTDTIGGAGVHGIAFRFSTNAGDTTWQLVCSDGAAQTVTDTGVTVAAATRYALKIRVDEADGTVYASVNGSVEVSCATNVPANTANMGVAAKIIALENATKGLRIGQIYVEHD